MYSKGDKIKLNKTNLYSTYDSNTVEEIISGNYYIYSDIVKNDRIRITDSVDKVGKPSFCTGWIKLSDIDKNN